MNKKWDECVLKQFLTELCNNLQQKWSTLRLEVVLNERRERVAKNNNDDDNMHFCVQNELVSRIWSYEFWICFWKQLKEELKSQISVFSGGFVSQERKSDLTRIKLKH